MLQGDSSRMPCLITSIHDSLVLLETCRQFRAPAQQGTMQIGAQVATGWVVRLQGVHYPIVCDPLTGLVAYHPTDNAFLPFRTMMRFVQRYYAMRHRRQRQARLSPLPGHRPFLASAAG